MRVLIALLVGVVVAVAGSFVAWWVGAVMVGWIAAALVFLILTWSAVWGMNAERTARYATREDPTVVVTDVLLVVASLASIAGVIVLVAGSGNRVLAAAIGVGSVAAAWLVVHTLFTLQYAALYYRGEPGGIDFNQKARPDYLDFAYLGFTIGMTYQVSDTNIVDSRIRRWALQHGLLSFLLGAVVLASTINLVVNLAK